MARSKSGSCREKSRRDNGDERPRKSTMTPLPGAGFRLERMEKHGVKYRRDYFSLQTASALGATGLGRSFVRSFYAWTTTGRKQL